MEKEKSGKNKFRKNRHCDWIVMDLTRGEGIGQQTNVVELDSSRHFESHDTLKMLVFFNQVTIALWILRLKRGSFLSE
jgi:hypothetical protein